MTRYDTMTSARRLGREGSCRRWPEAAGRARYEAMTVVCHELERGHAGMQDDLAGQASRRAVLTGHEVDRRKEVLVRLQDVLAAQGFESVLVGRHALTLHSHGRGPAHAPSPRDPELHVTGAGRCYVITTDGRQYRFADSGMHPADDPFGAAGFVLSSELGPDSVGRQAPVPADHRAGGRDRRLVGAGERALRRLRDDGVI